MTIEKQAVLHLDCLSHVYSDGTVGIHDLCFKVFPKEIVCICGPNGAGKSTLIEHLNGILMPTEGEITLDGEVVDRRNPEKLRRSVGLVFQDADSQLFAPTVIDDVMFGPINNGLGKAEARQVAEWALNLVGFRERSKVPHFLSGGEKRLVAIAGVLAMKPRVLVVDEPTSDLDPMNAETIEGLLKRLRDELGISIVVSTHDMDLASRIADRLYVLKEGNVIAEGPPKEIFYNYQVLREARLKPPEVVELYHWLKAEGMVEGEAKPILREELISLIKPRGVG